MANLRTTIRVLAFFASFIFVSCSGHYNALVSPSTNTDEIPLERLGEDWDDESHTAGESKDELDLEMGDPSVVT